MNLLEIIRAEAGPRLRALIIVAMLAALANAVMLANILAAAAAPTEVGLRELAIFALCLALFVSCSRHVNRSFAELLEAALHRIRARIGAKLVAAEFEALERIAAAEICDRVTENMRFISERGSAITGMLQSALIVAFLAAYVGWLSLPALSLLALIAAVGIGLFTSMRREFVQAVRRTARLRVAFLARLGDLLDGFVELAFRRRARGELHADIGAASDSLRYAGIRSSRLLADNTMLTNTLVFALLAVVAFVLRQRVALAPDEFARLIAAAIFLRAPLTALSAGFLPYVRSNVSLAEIAALEAKLAHASADRAPAATEDPWPTPPTLLAARELRYRYPNTPVGPGFAIGPIDLELPAGAIVFIVGGNGSGKSTLFRLLAGLYRPSAGELRLDEVALTPAELPAYRERVSAVFGEFHLFERVYEPAQVDPAQVEALLERLGLTGVTAYVDGRFTKLALSRGQRKRLALLVTLLEDRPIVLLDEWAADQDPSFRREFYERLLPELRAAGKIVVAISHDDRYFDRADRVITMDYGRVLLEPGEEPPACA